MKTARGFTLVELLVVISIIAILSVIGITIFTNAQKSARDAKRKGDVEAYAKAMEISKAATGQYLCFGGTCSGPGFFGWAPATNLTTLKPNYLADLPADPSGQSCGYLIITDGSLYTVFTTLENSNDPLAQLAKGPPVHTTFGGGSQSADKKTFTTGASGSCQNTTYNYWVNSQQ